MRLTWDRLKVPGEAFFGALGKNNQNGKMCGQQSSQWKTKEFRYIASQEKKAEGRDVTLFLKDREAIDRQVTRTCQPCACEWNNMTLAISRELQFPKCLLEYWHTVQAHRLWSQNLSLGFLACKITALTVPTSLRFCEDYICSRRKFCVFAIAVLFC